MALHFDTDLDTRYRLSLSEDNSTVTIEQLSYGPQGPRVLIGSIHIEKRSIPALVEALTSALVLDIRD